LAVAPATVTEDGTANLIYTFTRTGLITSALAVSYTVGGNAIPGTDYTGIAATPVTKTVAFAAGSNSATVIVDPTADTDIEDNETVALTLAAGAGYSIGTTAAVTGTIIKDDFPVLTLAVSPASVTEDGATNLVYTFSRTGPITAALTVNYGITGTADATDYTGALPGTGAIRFEAGSATATVTIDPTVDTTIGPDETVALTLAAGTGYTIGTISAVVGTIRNDDLISERSIILPAGFSSLTLTGTARISGIGNQGDNILIGNDSDNKIYGRAGKDILTGSSNPLANDIDNFGYENFSDSLLSAFDVITDFRSVDRILAPLTTEGETLSSSLGTISSLSAVSIEALLTPSSFLADAARAFAVTGITGTFLALNDGTDGFQQNQDAIIHLLNYNMGSTTPIQVI